MTKAPQIKAQALTAGLFHAHKPPLVPAHFALPIIRAIPSCLSSGKLFPAFHTGHSSLPFIQAIPPCLSSGQFLPDFHPGNSSLPLIQAILLSPSTEQSYPCNPSLSSNSQSSSRPLCRIPVQHNLIFAIHPWPTPAQRLLLRSTCIPPVRRLIAPFPALING